MRTVSHTAQWTAAARALETEKPNPLIRDPLARYLAEPDGFQLLNKFGGGGLQEFVAIRTHFIDEVIDRVVNQGELRQIVFIAAGMDTRAYRLPWHADARVFEVDYEDLHDFKQTKLDQLITQAQVDRRTVNADLAQDWIPALVEQGFDKDKPTLWVAEALFFFLTDAQAGHLLETLYKASAPGSLLTLDLVNEELITNPGTQLFLSSLRSLGVPWLFGTNEPESFLSEHGWQVQVLSEPGEEGAGLAYWPYPVFPREIQSMPRNWLIQAVVKDSLERFEE